MQMAPITRMKRWPVSAMVALVGCAMSLTPSMTAYMAVASRARLNAGLCQGT